MNNTKTLAIVAILMAATLVVGVTFAATTHSAMAYYQKKGDKKDDKRDANGNTVTIQEDKQKASVSGWDNTAEQEAQNVICTHPGENATCTSESSATNSADNGGE
jgi:hypothetical protein